MSGASSEASSGGPSECFSLASVPGSTADLAFGPHVRRGLTAPAKMLSPVFFYDALGSKLFEAICRLEEYYPTRAEREILTFLHHCKKSHSPVSVEFIKRSISNHLAFVNYDDTIRNFFNYIH